MRAIVFGAAILVGVLGFGSLGCGDEDPGDAAGGGAHDGAGGGDGGGPDLALLPLSVGARWTYRVTDAASGASADKVSVVEAEEPVPGREAVTAFRVRTEKLRGVSVSWQAVVDGRVVRFREESYDAAGVKTHEEIYEPAKLRIDLRAERLAPGARWQETFLETSTDFPGGTTTLEKVQNWEVVAVGETIVASGRAYETIRLRRWGELGQSDKTYWFARGVGKVREEGGQTEVLLGYSIP